MHILVIVLFGISVVLSMFGKGGGEFFVPVFLTAGIPYQQAASTSLFILMVSGMVMMFVFHKNALLDWLTGSLVVLSSASGAFLGGFISSDIEPKYLKMTFAILLLISAFYIYHPPEKKMNINLGPVVKRVCCGECYNFPLVILPLTFAIGFVASMVGISGGGLIVPLLIILGNMPLRIAFATNSIMVLFSSATGFLGHGIKGFVDWRFSIEMASAVAIGAFIGANLSKKVAIQRLKKMFAYVLVAASMWMVMKIFI